MHANYQYVIYVCHYDKMHLLYVNISDRTTIYTYFKVRINDGHQNGIILEIVLGIDPLKKWREQSYYVYSGTCR